MMGEHKMQAGTPTSDRKAFVGANTGFVLIWDSIAFGSLQT
jgi:hypothetical protein